MIGQVVVSCVPPGVRKAPIVGVFEWDGSAWDVIGEGVGVVRLSSSYEGQLRQTPAMMAAFPAMLLGMEQVDASARRKRTRIGARSIATAHYRTVRKTWPRATWHVHKRPEAPVLAVDGGKIVAVVAPFADNEVVKRLEQAAARALVVPPGLDVNARRPVRHPAPPAPAARPEGMRPAEWERRTSVPLSRLHDACARGAA